jgi:hypothetical protein
MTGIRGRVDRLDGGKWVLKPVEQMTDTELWRLIRKDATPAELAVIDSGTPAQVDALFACLSNEVTHG